jgi:O-6-methylguanine DNA methyltransferase
MKLMDRDPYRGRALIVRSPVGSLGLVENGQALTHLIFGGEEQLPPGTEVASSPLLEEGAEQLKAYFDGLRRNFDLPLSPFGTDFQRRVWTELMKIPFGQTASYAQVAEAVGSPEAYRAVGQANNRNPIAIIIPCHRIVGRDGQLTGYAGGLETKDFLLRLESDVVCGRLRDCPSD